MSGSGGGGTRIIGRYALYAQIASGGMASVHLGRLLGQAGFSRTVAIKRLHPHLAQDPEFVSMLLDEARLAARIRHPNVVATVDVVALEGELLVVMEYVHGESLSHLLRKLRHEKRRVPPQIACSIMAGVLYGLHAAHEATNERGEPLGIIHRDVSPQNVMVGADGVARVVDFGVAKAAGRLQETREGQLKGKIRYMAPEQVARGIVGRSADTYSASVVLWETLTGKRLFDDDNDFHIAERILLGSIDPPSKHAPDVPPALDELVLRGLHREPKRRFETAFEMATALEEAVTPATARQVARWVEEVIPDVIRQRAAKLAEVEGQSTGLGAPIERDSTSSPSSSSAEASPVLVPARAVRASAADTMTDAAATEPSDPSSISHAVVEGATVTIPGVRPLSRRALAGAAVGGAALVVLGLVLLLRSGSGDPSSGASTMPSASASARLVGTASAAVPTASQAPTRDPAPVAPATTPSATTPAPPASSAPVVTKPPPKPYKPTGKPRSCNPPYYFDKDGVKHLKGECL